MIEINWLQAIQPEFRQALQTIWDCPMLDGGTSYTAHRMQKAIEKVQKEANEVRLGILKKHAKTDAKGNPVSNETGHFQFEKPENEAAFVEEFMKDMSGRKTQLKITKLDFQKLSNVRGIMPRMWEHLAPICENMPIDEDGFEIGNAQLEAPTKPPMDPVKKKRTLP